MLKKKIKIYLKPFLNVKFLLSFGLAWVITNGWAYICLGIGIAWKIKWLTTLCSSYIAFLYLPFTAEKLITIPLAIYFQTKLFPKDEKLHNELVEIRKVAIKDWQKVKSKMKKRNVYKIKVQHKYSDINGVFHRATETFIVSAKTPEEAVVYVPVHIMSIKSIEVVDIRSMIK